LAKKAGGGPSWRTDIAMTCPMALKEPLPTASTWGPGDRPLCSVPSNKLVWTAATNAVEYSI